MLRTAPVGRSLPIPHLLLPRLSVAPDPTRQRARPRPITRIKRLRRRQSLPKPTARAGRHSTAGATLRYVHSFAAYLRSFVPYACRLPPLRSVPRSTHPPAATTVTPSYTRPRRHAAPAQKKGPTPPVSPPLIRLQATGRKSLPPANKACVQATQAEARPASRRVSLGSTPSPRHHAPANARSSSSASAAQKGPLPPHKAGSAE